MKILSIGTFSSYGISNTCLHRNWVLQRIGETDSIDTTYNNNLLLRRIIHFLFVKFKMPINYNYASLNEKIIRQVHRVSYDIIWIDKGIQIKPKTLRIIKEVQPHAILIGYSPDNMCMRHNQSQFFIDGIKYYDYYVTTKSYIVETLKKMGVNKVLFVNNAYEETFHHPYKIDEAERIRLGGFVGFIGSWEKERCEQIIYLAANGIPVRVWGGGKWLKYKRKHKNLIIESQGLFSEDYNKALSAFDISLCFLRKINLDQQTTRSVEIPACGSMLMAERTEEHLNLFKENREAVFFSSKEELLAKCKYFIKHPKEVKKISEAGRKRCVESGYSNYFIISNVIKTITNRINK